MTHSVDNYYAKRWRFATNGFTLIRIISMLFSLRRFDAKVNESDSLGLFLNALVRPFIGLSFAHLSFFMLESGLLQDINVSDSTNLHPNNLIHGFEYHVSIAFITGFTERIAKVIQPGNDAENEKKQKNDLGVEKNEK